MNLFRLIFLVYRRGISILRNCYAKFVTVILFYLNNIEFSNFRTSGVPLIRKARKANGMTIGRGFAMNNGIANNPIGCPQPCTFFLDNNSTIKIGDNVGISQTSLISYCSITIGNNVKIGGGTCIFTSDFHSLDYKVRASAEDCDQAICKPVVIEDDVFIGAHCIILKGVRVGSRSIIGAGSVVTKNIPSKQIWAGNPARFIKDIVE